MDPKGNNAGTPVLTAKGVPLRGVGKAPVNGEVLRWDRPISFLGDVDPVTGEISRNGATGNVKDKVLVFPEGAGSTVGSYVIFNMRLNGTAPKAMVMRKAEAIIAMGCIMADIPLVHRLTEEEMGMFSTGDWAELDPVEGTVRLWQTREGVR